MDEEIRKILDQIRELNKERKFQESLNLIEKSDKKNEPALLNMTGFLKMNLGKYEDAIKYYDEAIKKEKNAAFLYSNKAFVYFKIGNWKNTIKNLDTAIKLNPNVPEFYELRSKAKMLNNNIQEAIEDIDNAIKLNPTQEKFYEKKKELINIIKLKTETENSAESLFENAREYFKKKEFNTAIALLEQAIKIKEKGEFYEMLGVSYANLNGFEKSLKELEKAKKLEPKKDSIYRNIAKTLIALGGIKNHKQALKHYDEAIKIESKSIWYWERSFVYLRLKENKKALQDIDKALDKDPLNPMFLTRKGDIYAHLGEFNKALKYYDSALEIDPLNKEIYDRKENVLLAKEKKIDLKETKGRTMYG